MITFEALSALLIMKPPVVIFLPQLKAALTKSLVAFTLETQHVGIVETSRQVVSPQPLS